MDPSGNAFREDFDDNPSFDLDPTSKEDALFTGGDGLAGGSGTGTLYTGGKFNIWKEFLDSWKAVEDSLRAAFSGQSKTFHTPAGKRVVDSYGSDGIIREAKYGYQCCTKRLMTQAVKDTLIRQGMDTVSGAEWHFYWSTVSGSGGPSKQLREYLEKLGIKIYTH